MTGLTRSLNLADAIGIGLASILGAGVFAVFAPAAAAAGAWLPLALVLAAIVAVANALSTAQLAAQFPVAGGAYFFGRTMLGPWPGFAAGWLFVVGKTASCGAIALTAGAYLWPDRERLVAAVAVAAMAGINLAGVRRTARAAQVSVAFVIATLLLVMVLGFEGSPELSIDLPGTITARGVMQAAGLLFFAFAGYARIATLGEEVRDPERTIPRAVITTLVVTLVLYLALSWLLLTRLGVARLAESSAPLRDLVSGTSWATTLVVVAAGVACLGSLLALLAGISRTSLAMARERDLPRFLAQVSPNRSVPARAELLVAAVVVALVLTVELREVIAFSSVGVLGYYLVANLSALRQEPAFRRYPRAVPVIGALGCVALLACLPAAAIALAAGLLAVGALGRWIRLSR